MRKFTAVAVVVASCPVGCDKYRNLNGEKACITPFLKPEDGERSSFSKDNGCVHCQIKAELEFFDSRQERDEYIATNPVKYRIDWKKIKFNRNRWMEKKKSIMKKWK
jgi:hypothetical protein